MQQHLYGIDFGTSNSVLSIFDKEEQEIIATISIPSILYFSIFQEENGKMNYYVGEEAIQAYVREGMKGRFMKSIKQVLPVSNFSETRIGNDRFSAADLVALIITDLKKKADAIVGYDCQSAIVGRPVFFDDMDKAKDDLAQVRLLEAAQKAGFSIIRFQLEPISAAFTYEQTISKPEKVLVADLGGGTSDFTFIQLDPSRMDLKNRREDIIAVGGVYIGGDNLDAAFMWEKGTPHFGRGVKYESMPSKWVDLPPAFFQNICSWKEINFFNGTKVRNSLQQYYLYTKKNPLLKNMITLIDNNLSYSVFQAIETTKIELSTNQTSVFEYACDGIEIKEQVDLGMYNDIVADEVSSIMDYLDRFLAKHQIESTLIDSIFITGGTSLVGKIQCAFKEKFPSISIHTGDHFMSVSKGLALSGYLIDEMK